MKITLVMMIMRFRLRIMMIGRFVFRFVARLGRRFFINILVFNNDFWFFILIFIFIDDLFIIILTKVVFIFIVFKQ